MGAYFKHSHILFLVPNMFTKVKRKKVCTNIKFTE